MDWKDTSYAKKKIVQWVAISGRTKKRRQKGMSYAFTIRATNKIDFRWKKNIWFFTQGLCVMGKREKKSVFLYKPNIVRSNREILSVSIHIYSRVLQQITLSKNRKCLLIQTVWTQACQCCIKLRRPSQTAIFVALRRLKIVRAFAACHNGINKFHETALKWPSSFRRKYVNLLSLMPA